MPFNTIEKYKAWKEKNKDKILFQRKQYRLKNKKRLCEESKKYYYDNYEKVMKRYKKYREDPEIFKYKKLLKMKSNLKLSYKITVEEYNKKLKEQKNRCAICNKHKNKFKRNLAVDHCHTTGQIRDLLCGICNTRLGYYEKSDINKLKTYIEKHKRKLN
jgi:Recombination endonuclease VII